MVTERVTRNQVNVVALMDTLETLVKCLVSAILSIFWIRYYTILLRNILCIRISGFFILREQIITFN